MSEHTYPATPNDPNDATAPVGPNPGNAGHSTTVGGGKAASDRHSLTLGPDGPILLHDHHLVTTLAHFNRENIPDRKPHAKGAGAFGEFVVVEHPAAVPADLRLVHRDVGPAEQGLGGRLIVRRGDGEADRRGDDVLAAGHDPYRRGERVPDAVGAPLRLLGALDGGAAGLLQRRDEQAGELDVRILRGVRHLRYGVIQQARAAAAVGGRGARGDQAGADQRVQVEADGGDVQVAFLREPVGVEGLFGGADVVEQLDAAGRRECRMGPGA